MSNLNRNISKQEVLCLGDMIYGDGSYYVQTTAVTDSKSGEQFIKYSEDGKSATIMFEGICDVSSNTYECVIIKYYYFNILTNAILNNYKNQINTIKFTREKASDNYDIIIFVKAGMWSTRLNPEWENNVALVDGININLLSLLNFGIAKNDYSQFTQCNVGDEFGSLKVEIAFKDNSDFTNADKQLITYNEIKSISGLEDQIIIGDSAKQNPSTCICLNDVKQKAYTLSCNKNFKSSIITTNEDWFNEYDDKDGFCISFRAKVNKTQKNLYDFYNIAWTSGYAINYNFDLTSLYTFKYKLNLYCKFGNQINGDTIIYQIIPFGIIDSTFKIQDHAILNINISNEPLNNITTFFENFNGVDDSVYEFLAIPIEYEKTKIYNGKYIKNMFANSRGNIPELDPPTRQYTYSFCAIDESIEEKSMIISLPDDYGIYTFQNYLTNDYIYTDNIVPDASFYDSANVYIDKENHGVDFIIKTYENSYSVDINNYVIYAKAGTSYKNNTIILWQDSTKKYLVGEYMYGQPLYGWQQSFKFDLNNIIPIKMHLEDSVICIESISFALKTWFINESGKSVACYINNKSIGTTDYYIYNFVDENGELSQKTVNIRAHGQNNIYELEFNFDTSQIDTISCYKGNEIIIIESGKVYTFFESKYDGSYSSLSFDLTFKKKSNFNSLSTFKITLKSVSYEPYKS